MAYTVTKAQTTTFGNQRVWQGVVTADATTGVVSFGFQHIYHVQATAKSAASAPNLFSANETATGTESQGDLAITGVASGDDFYLIVYGR